jgi:hypothetical protein
MGKQRVTNTSTLSVRQHICVPDQSNVLNVLRTHHPNEPRLLSVSNEQHPAVDLRMELVERHVRLAPAVRWNHASVSRSSGVDDLPDPHIIGIHAWRDHLTLQLRVGGSIHLAMPPSPILAVTEVPRTLPGVRGMDSYALLIVSVHSRLPSICPRGCRGDHSTIA